MAETKDVYGKVIGARYYPEQKIILVLLQDINTQQRYKPIRIGMDAFTFHKGNDPDREMHRVAELLSKFPHPITLRTVEGETEPTTVKTL